MDLAGSERAKASQAVGDHLRETCHINKSLSTLGRVIMELVEVQRNQQDRHIPYRDSRLTYLLQVGLCGGSSWRMWCLSVWLVLASLSLIVLFAGVYVVDN